VPDVEQVASDDLEALSVLMTQRGNTIAAILAEPLQGAGGVYPPSADYLKGLRKLCDQHGAFLIFDEVITGFARLGTWFGANFYGANPDLLCFAKAVTSGYQPLGGVFVGNAVRKPLEATHIQVMLRPVSLPLSTLRSSSAKVYAIVQLSLASESVMHSRRLPKMASLIMRVVMAQFGPPVFIHHRTTSRFAIECLNLVRLLGQ
jgi:glutamate-1-semialdehyde aminotransferase